MIETPFIAWDAFLPEIILAAGAMTCLLVGIVRRTWAVPVAHIAAAVAVVLAGAAAIDLFDTPMIDAWSGQLDSDQLSMLARVLVAGTLLCAIAMSPWSRPNEGRHAEHLALLLLAGAGMGLFAAAGSLVSLFVGLELFSISLYVLAALQADVPRRLEAGLKYLVLGGIAAAVMLYGIALVYGATGTFSLAGIGAAADRGPLLWVGSALVLAGLLFKASAAPLHVWTPDVYDGAPTTTVSFMASATKVVALVALLRVVQTSFGVEADLWEPLVVSFAVASIIIGNLGALRQDKVKRMLAYSSVAHAGYALIGVAAHETLGVAATVYYVVIYAAMTVGAFALIAMRERQLDSELTYDDLDGSGWPSAGSPIVSAMPGIAMVVLMLSMAGIPPAAGFFAKLAVFQAAVDGGLAWLAVVGVVGSVISLAYYLRVIAHMYMRPAPARTSVGDRNPVMALVGVIGAGFVLVTGLLPGTAYDPASDAGTALERGVPGARR